MSSKFAFLTAVADRHFIKSVNKNHDLSCSPLPEFIPLHAYRPQGTLYTQSLVGEGGNKPSQKISPNGRGFGL